MQGTFNVDGGGATVDYLGVGVTLIGGSGQGFNAVPTVWLHDPNGFTGAMFDFAPAFKGDSVLTLATDPTFPVGARLYLAGPPASNSSSGPNGDNYIPLLGEYVKVTAINGRQVTLQSPLLESYQSTRAAFYTAGLAQNCTISDLNLSTTTDAYQFYGKSGFNIRLTGINFMGNAAVGACTFMHGFVMENCMVDGAYGGIAFARGTGTVTVRNLVWRQRGGTAQFIAIQVEENCYDVLFDRVDAFGGAVNVVSLNMVGTDSAAPATRRRIVIDNSRFDTRFVTGGGSSSPFQCGAALGVDILVNNTIMAGAPVVPDPSQFPGNIGKALCWLSSNAAFDTVRFTDSCSFLATEAAPAFATGSAGSGTFKIAERAAYVNAAHPGARYSTYGPWTSLAGQMPLTPPVGGFSPLLVRVEGATLRWDGTFSVAGVADGTVITQLNAGMRPAATRIIAADAYDGTSCVRVGLQIETNGRVTIYNRMTASIVFLNNVEMRLD